MEAPTSFGRRVRAGLFEVDLGSGEVHKNGRKVPLQEQPFRVLAMLLERPGEIITREELQANLWPADTFVSFDESINTAIRKLRVVFGDSADNPRFIETIPRRGYRFIAPAVALDSSEVQLPTEAPTVSSASGTSEPLMAQALPAHPSDRSVLEVAGAAGRTIPFYRVVGVARKRYAVLVACVVIPAALLLAYHFWSQSKTSTGPAKISQISHWNKPMNDTFLSPDGRAIAFDSPVGGVAQVFLMLTSGGETLQLTSDEGDKTVDAFSPDGKEIYYGRSLGRDEVWMVPTLGGTPRRVAAAWYALPSADGASVYYDKSDRPGIFRADKSGLNEELIYSSQDPTLRFFPALLFPGGNDLLAVAFPRDSPNVRNFFRINLTTHEAVDLGQVVRNGDAAWAEPGKTLLFSRTVNGLTNIWRYALLDRSLTQITFGTGPDFFPMRDPGGEGIYYVNGKSTGYLTAYHVHSKESVDIVAEDATQPAISPDGKRVMYITLPAPYKTDPWVSDKTELWVSDIEGGKKVKVATGVSLQTGTWASDNFHLSFIEAGVGAASRAYIVGADGTGLTQLPPTGAETNTAVWSADQKSVFLSVVEKVGSMGTVWKWRVGDSNLEKFVDDCGQVSDVDPSGQYLLGNVLQGERIGIYEVSVSDRKCFPLLPGIPTFAATFARDGKSFMYAVASGGDVKIYRQPWKKGKTVGKPQVALKVPFVFPLAYQGNGNAYDFSKDLSSIVYARPGGYAELYLLSQK